MTMTNSDPFRQAEQAESRRAESIKEGLRRRAEQALRATEQIDSLLAELQKCRESLRRYRIRFASATDRFGEKRIVIDDRRAYQHFWVIDARPGPNGDFVYGLYGHVCCRGLGKTPAEAVSILANTIVSEFRDMEGTSMEELSLKQSHPELHKAICSWW
jgi:hypothetical protein